MDSIQMRAYGKINLSLDVTGKRDNGYHDVRMIMQTVGIYDQITIRKMSGQGIKVTTNLSFLPVDENNLVYKAAKLLMDEFNIDSGVSISLKKNIPVAAGMAGGSSDAAAVFVGMNRMFELKLSKKELMERGVKLGADIPYCIMRGTVLAEGIGEVLTPLKAMPDCHILIAKPHVNVSTAFVYKNLHLDSIDKHPDVDRAIAAIDAGDIKELALSMENILETVTVPAYPVIEDLKNLMKEGGALNAIMSGSGPTVFGIYDDKEQAGGDYKLVEESGLARQLFLTRPFNVNA